MTRFARLLIVILVLGLAAPACRQERPVEEPFAFVVFPGARYLPHITELTKQAHRIAYGKTEVAPMAIYDTDATVDDVARYYVKEYGYEKIEEYSSLAEASALAYRRSGDLARDAKTIESLIPKLGLKTDVSKATGSYNAVEIKPKVSRPRVTIQRPYFDVTTSQVVDRTLIWMSKG